VKGRSIVFDYFRDSSEDSPIARGDSIFFSLLDSRLCGLFDVLRLC
jgi:hypothetical protein